MSLISTIPITEEMKKSYLDYAMSVIVSRAIPDVRDGLKPVHRRILYAMEEGGYTANRPYRKSARIVGDVMGKYHPHGNDPIYEAMARMVQDFSMRLPLIDGQGNFGSMDGDSPAAMRYTEARLAKSAHYLLEDIDKETVDFQPNYDESSLEPQVLPARFPNLLVNGGGGIAVGMATNIPTHNLGEIIDACCALIDNPDLSFEELLSIVPGPDFPTGGTILGSNGIQSALRTGRGSVIMRGRTNIENIRKDRQAIIITEIPFQVNKSRLIDRIAEVANEKIVEGISDLRDESDRDGVRIVIELKREATPEVVLNQLYRHTPLQTSFGVNMLVLNGNQPMLMNTRQVLKAFLSFREEIITRRTKYELQKARERVHLSIGYMVAIANLDEVIIIIRQAESPAIAKTELMGRAWPAADIMPFVKLVEGPSEGVSYLGREENSDENTYRLSEVQAKAILDLKLHRLTSLERDKIEEEFKQTIANISDMIEILGSREKLLTILRNELLEVKTAYATPRRTTIEHEEFSNDIEGLIKREDIVVTFSLSGYIKRVPISAYRSQKRGGKGRSGMATKEEDIVTNVFVVNTHTTILFFSSSGIVYQLKGYQLPPGDPQSRGKAIVNLLPMENDERIATVMPLPDKDQWEKLSIVFATSKGDVRRNALSDFVNVRSNGKIAIKLNSDERLIGVATCEDSQNIFLATKKGKCIRFPVMDVRQFVGHNSTGVRAIKLSKKGDEVVSMSILNNIEASRDEREAYIKQANQLRRTDDEEDKIENNEDEEDALEEKIEDASYQLSPQKFQELQQTEEFIMTVTSNGFGKRTSAYEYRITGRAGSGITNILDSQRNGEVVRSFPVESSDHLVLVTNSGKIIRCPVSDVRITGRNTKGVNLFSIDYDERVVSIARIPEEEQEDGEEIYSEEKA